jgi:hypothetical protein
MNTVSDPHINFRSQSADTYCHSSKADLESPMPYRQLDKLHFKIHLPNGGQGEDHMKRLFAVAALLFFPLLMMAQVIPNASSPAVPANQSTKFKFTQDGAFANVSFSSTTNGSTSINLSVATGLGSTDSLQIGIVTESADFNTLTFSNVFGTIDGSAFTGQNTQNLALNIDTTAVSTLTSETCTLVFSPFSFSCGAGPAGAISLSWRENDNISTTTNDHTKSTVGPVTTITNQHSDNSTANVSGTIFGTDVSGASANVGVNHMSTIQVMR